MKGSYLDRTPKSRLMFERCKKIQPAGVSYKFRLFDPYPFFVKQAKGARLIDVDGNEYTDYWCTHFSMILGHAPSSVQQAINRQAENCWHFGLEHELEIIHAEKLCQHVPSAEMVRYTSSATEANLFAVRLARTYTKRNKIAKFKGGWHGPYDPLHIAVKPPFDEPASGGLTKSSQEDTIVVPYNDLNGFLDRVKGQQLACVLLEPVLGAGGIIPAYLEFLKGLREYCDDTGALLMYDEVITGFRLGLGGAQERFNVIPDVTVLGKIIGGGLPIGAICGSREIMERMDHTQFHGVDYAYHGGTFAGNALSLAAGSATIETLEHSPVYSRLSELGARVRDGLSVVFDGLPVTVTGVDSLFAIHLNGGQPHNSKKSASLPEASHGLFRWLLENGILMLSPDMLHGAISYAHTDDDIEFLVSTIEKYVNEHKSICN
jgi:glutamate-1-semialdehyde 2,1-aminomutase